MPPLLALRDAVATLQPVSTEDPRSTEARTPATRRPTGWIVLCGLLLIAVAGLAVWAFSAQSDADDAQAKLDAQERAAAAATPTPEPEPAEPVQLDPETQERFQELAEGLGATGDSIDQIEQELDQASAKVEDAEQLRQDASGVVDAAKAEAEAFKAQFELTKTCLRGTLDAVAAAYAGGNLDAAVQELEKLSGNCRSAASS